MFFGVVHEGIYRVEYPVPAPELFANIKVFPYHFGSIGAIGCTRTAAVRTIWKVSASTCSLKSSLFSVSASRIILTVLVHIPDIGIHKVHNLVEFEPGHQPFIFEDSLISLFHNIFTDFPYWYFPVAVFLGCIETGPYCRLNTLVSRFPSFRTGSLSFSWAAGLNGFGWTPRS